LTRSLRWLPTVVLCLVLLLAGGVVLVDARQATPVAGTPAAGLPGVTSEVFGRTEPEEALGQELALGRVTLAPGAVIPPHEHPGTQLAAIMAGELAYTVLTNEVRLVRATVDGGAPAATEGIVAGETVALRPGDVVVEVPGAVHTARNDGDEPVEILLSTLFPIGATRTQFVGTPAPGAAATPMTGIGTGPADGGLDIAAPTAAGFVGAWIVEPTIAGQAAPAFTTFMADGTIFTSNRPVQPAVPGLTDGPIAQSLGHGAWVATGERTAAITFMFIQTDLAGTYVGTRTITGSLEMDASGTSWSGTFGFTTADAAGVEILTGEGTVRATRIVTAPVATAGTPAP